MQSAELDNRTTSLKESSHSAEMTIGLSRPISPNQLHCNSQFSSDTDFSLDRVKLESFIERVDTDSHVSSDIGEEPIDINQTLLPPNDPSSPHDPLENIQEHNPHESIRSWLQRVTQMQNEIQKKMNKEAAANKPQSPPKTIPKPSRVVKYEDLPYMGEMTLENSKPRRGRKPKKADICHLIYKNYGTIFPGAPESMLKDLTENENKKKTINNQVSSSLSRNNVQNKIISSLLEKRLTQETPEPNSLTESLASRLLKPQKPYVCDQNQNEPLNLCIKDLNQLKIRLCKKEDIYTSEPIVKIKTEPQSDDEVEIVSETPLNSPGVANNLYDTKHEENTVGPGGYIYWPNAGVFIHPMALQQQLLYYQQMASNSNFTLPNHSPLPPPEGTPHSNKPPELRKLAPKLLPKKLNPPKFSPEAQHYQEPKTKRNASSVSDKSPVKRKRSAIFIPPIPPENQTNPATEVSICKFKFTGGAKPSLQEKKMLSVDSGGNFRYYSGTGDKNMRGYEFFPRQTLQQQIESAHGSSTGAFLQASGEKIFPSPYSDTSGNSHSPHELVLGPNISPSSLGADIAHSVRHKKRKSRKSLQREKLEQTFKEKGFLIQTQQLESAEGATYCKFRQLRKFTRYLFRSWKDYLPGSVRELHEGEDEVEPDMEEMSMLSAPELSPASLNIPS